MNECISIPHSRANEKAAAANRQTESSDPAPLICAHSPSPSLSLFLKPLNQRNLIRRLFPLHSSL